MEVLADLGTLEMACEKHRDAVRLAELRWTESVVVLDELKAWFWEQALLTSISIGEAAAYTLANWERLTRFVEDARLPLDNNECGRRDASLHRGVA